MDEPRCFGKKITDTRLPCPHRVRWIITAPMGEELAACHNHKAATDVYRWKARPFHG